MYDEVFTFRSLTAAQRGQLTCSRYNIPTALVRVPTTMSSKGCGYGLRISSSDVKQAVLIFRLENISFEHVYHTNGELFQEVFV